MAHKESFHLDRCLGPRLQPPNPARTTPLLPRIGESSQGGRITLNADTVTAVKPFLCDCIVDESNRDVTDPSMAIAVARQNSRTWRHLALIVVSERPLSHFMYA